MIATSSMSILAVWSTVIALAYFAPNYTSRMRVPWPLVAMLFLLLMTGATAATWLLVQTLPA